MIGPNSPTAPVAMTSEPNGVGSSPASRRIGRMVPSAVVVSTSPVKAPSRGFGLITAPTTSATATLISHAAPARWSGPPRSLAKSIS